MTVRIGFAQFAPIFGDVSANLALMERLTAQAENADLLVFPELAVTGYDFLHTAEARDLAEPFGVGPTSQCLQRLAVDHAITLVAGYAEAVEAGVFNACMLARPDGQLFNYRKIHLYARENEIFFAGDAPPPVIDTPAGRVGLMICFDWFFPETARLLALAGADVIAHPSNLVMPYCQRAMYARSVENRVFSITANRTGTEDRTGRSLTFTGASQMLDIDGQCLAQADVDGECVCVVEATLQLARNKSLNEYNDLWRNRRTDLYAGLL